MGAERIRYACEVIAEKAAEAFRELLENRHLYQHVDVDLVAIVAGAVKTRQNAAPEDRQSDEASRSMAIQVGRQRWRESRSSEPQPGQNILSIVFRIPPVQMFCTSCKDRQPYNVVYAEDILRFTVSPPVGTLDPLARETAAARQAMTPVVQIFSIALLCQGCQRLPEVVLVRRDSQRLTLSGRSPIENVAVPKFIPAAQAKFYRSAIIAFNSNQILAADSLLRIFIEQFVASQVTREDNDRADDLLAKYAEKLPVDFKDRFPSLTDVYARLSKAIHSADEDEKVFEAARVDVDRHFDARRLFNL